MKFNLTPLKDAYTIDVEKRGDDRGFFARVFCENEFAEHGLETRFVQVNNSLSAKRSTLRGLHYQLAPAAEVKVVRCIRGAAWDAIVDIRPDSPTFGQWFGARPNRRMMCVPRLRPCHPDTDRRTELLYLVSAFYAPKEGEACAGMIRALASNGRCSPPKSPTRTKRGPTLIATFMASRGCRCQVNSAHRR